MKSMTRKNKLRVALVMAYTTTFISTVGIASTWLSIRTAGYGLLLVGGLYGVYYILEKSEVGE